MFARLSVHFISSRLNICWENSGGSRNSQTGRGKSQSLGQNLSIWQDFCRKLHENERNWTERGRCIFRAPLKPLKLSVNKESRWVCRISVCKNLYSSKLFLKTLLDPVVDPGFPRPLAPTPRGYQPIIWPNFLENA